MLLHSQLHLKNEAFYFNDQFGDKKNVNTYQQQQAYHVSLPSYKDAWCY